MPSPDRPSPINRKKKTPLRAKQSGVSKAPKKSSEEEGVDTANDFMRKFMKKSEKS
jgi:hypothetical protein